MVKQVPMAEAGKICPLHKLDMSEVCHKCPWWTALRGDNPNTGEPLDQFGCAVTWLPILLIENANEVRKGSASTDSFRNQFMALAGFPAGHPSAAIEGKRG